MATTKMRNRGKNINEILDPNNAPDDAKIRALRRTMLVNSLNTSRCTTSQDLADRFNKLFELCFNNNFIPTVEMLALAAGFDRTTLWNIEKEDIYKGTGMSDIVKNAKGMIAALEAELARDGEINATVYIFRAKNYFGMTDKQEVVVTPNNLPKSDLSEEEILNNLPKLNEGNADK